MTCMYYLDVEDPGQLAANEYGALGPSYCRVFLESLAPQCPFKEYPHCEEVPDDADIRGYNKRSIQDSINALALDVILKAGDLK